MVLCAIRQLYHGDIKLFLMYFIKEHSWMCKLTEITVHRWNVVLFWHIIPTTSQTNMLTVHYDAWL